MEYSTPAQTLFRSNLIFLYFLFQIWNVEDTAELPEYHFNLHTRPPRGPR